MNDGCETLVMNVLAMYRLHWFERNCEKYLTVDPHTEAKIYIHQIDEIVNGIIKLDANQRPYQNGCKCFNHVGCKCPVDNSDGFTCCFAVHRSSGRYTEYYKREAMKEAAKKKFPIKIYTFKEVCDINIGDRYTE